MFCRCSLTVRTSFWNNSAMSAWLSQSVSSTKRHSTRVRPSSVWYRTISPVGGAGSSGRGGRFFGIREHCTVVRHVAVDGEFQPRLLLRFDVDHFRTVRLGQHHAEPVGHE